MHLKLEKGVKNWRPTGIASLIIACVFVLPMASRSLFDPYENGKTLLLGIGSPLSIILEKFAKN